MRIVGRLVFVSAFVAASSVAALRHDDIRASTLAVSSPAPAAARVEPKPLRGVPLSGRTGLRLLVADVPPFILDVDSGRTTRISGLRVRGHAVLSVLPVGKDAIVWLARSAPARKTPTAEIYLVRRGTAKAKRLATGWEVAPADDGAAVWLKSYEDPRRCTLREVSLDGRERQGPRPVSCSARLVDTGGGALLVDGGSVLDPQSGEAVLRAERVWAKAGDVVLALDGAHGPLILADLRSAEGRTLPWPSEIGADGSQGGADESRVHPNGRLIALAFSDPSFEGTGAQVTDFWLLDAASGDLRHLPDMPAGVALKSTSISWASDGRLVILGESGQRQIVAVWKPGRQRIAVRRVRMPTRRGGSDTFVVWPGRA